MRTTNGGNANVSILGRCRRIYRLGIPATRMGKEATRKARRLGQRTIRKDRRINKFSLFVLFLLGLPVHAGTITIEAVGPNFPGRKVFTCERIESTELYYDDAKGGWRSVPKTGILVEPCSAGIYPSRNYHIYIRMDVYDDANNLTKTYKLPPYSAFVNPNTIPEEMRPKPPVLRIVYNSNKIKDLAVL